MKPFWLIVWDDENENELAVVDGILCHDTADALAQYRLHKARGRAVRIVKVTDETPA